MYEQSLVKTVEPIKLTTVHRYNKVRSGNTATIKSTTLLLLSQDRSDRRDYRNTKFVIALPPEPKNLNKGANKWARSGVP